MPKRGSPAIAITCLAIAPLACGPSTQETPRNPASPAPPIAAPSAPSTAAPRLPLGHTAIAEARVEPLPFVLQPIDGARSALAVAQAAGERAAWARRIDAGGAMGEVQRFLDRRVASAIEGASGPTWITSDGARLCFHRAGWPIDGACVTSAPASIVPVGDRVALLELTSKRPVEPASRAPKAAPKAKASKAAGKKASAKKKAAPSAPARRPSHPLVELFVRWIDERGAIDAEPKATGLHFEAPLEGMTLADARARPPGIDVLWYETAPGRKARSALGSGRLMAASLRADGALDFASRVAVLDADVEYGRLKDHTSPRLVGDDTATAYLGAGPKGECEAIRVFPKLGSIAPPKAACAVAPHTLAGALESIDTAVLDRILGDEPRRAFAQPKGDFGRAVWAGERAYWQREGKLRSASRADGAPRDEPAPFPARRARIAWAAMTSDGEGVALVDGSVRHVDARRAPPAVEAGRLPASGLPLGAFAGAEIPADRRRAARIGSTWWSARGDRARLWPPSPNNESSSNDVQRPSTRHAIGRHPDTSVLVGGRSGGFSIDVAAGSLAVSGVNEAGTSVWLTSRPTPVRLGFDACERAAGGAIVAGVDEANPNEVVALVVDAIGAPRDPKRVPLPIRAGELGVRLVPLPSGGAWLTDLDRRHVVWLDDEARPLGSADWPAEESDAACLDGRPMRRVVPGIAPGSMVPVPETAKDVCIVGDPMWGADGVLRWIGASTVGLDVHATTAALPLLPAVSPAPPAGPLPPSPPPSPPSPLSRCNPDMVSIGGRFCIDRFESTILDNGTLEPLSPDYPTTPNLLDFVLGEWSTARERTGNIHARAFPLPWISPARIGHKPDPIAVSRLGARPNGYLTGIVAEAACAAAGKRLCTLDEFVMACRGEGDTQFPYGDTYEEGVCNVFRDEHPAVVLHNNASVGHLDPRLNRVWSKGKPLLQRTGESPACRSKWGTDAVYDMVGNLDEWVNEGNGAFAGGFYSRSTRSGCEAVVTAHPKSYLDYSTGARCCSD